MSDTYDITAGHGHKFGNYRKYYEFHPTSERTQLIKTNDIIRRIWNSLNQPQTFAVLDVGCNEGNLSLDLYSLIKSELPSNVHV